MNHAVEVEGAVVLLDRFPALAGLDLTLGNSSVTLVQGPNGAGKTTLLRLLAGLVPLAKGRASVLGLDVATRRRDVRAAVGLVAPTTMMYEELTVAENLEFWTTLSGFSDAAIPAAIERVGLTDQAQLPVRVLSTGQRRRAAIATVVLRRPQLWLLDEPHAGLDKAGRNLVDGLIVEAIDAGATVVVASHELDRVRPLATQVATVAGGMVVSLTATDTDAESASSDVTAESSQTHG